MVGISSQQIGVGEFEITTQCKKNCRHHFEQFLLEKPTQQYLLPWNNLPCRYWPSALVSPASQLTVKGSSGSHVTFLLERTTSK